jgi:signal transduction histidine kinase
MPGRHQTSDPFDTLRTRTAPAHRRLESQLGTETQTFVAKRRSGYAGEMAPTTPDADLSDRGVTRLTVIFVLLGFFGLLVGGVAAGLLMVENQRRTEWVNHTYEVERRIYAVRLDMERLESSRRGYLLNGDQSFRDLFTGAERELIADLATLRHVTADNQVQQANLDRLGGQTAKLRATLAASMASRTAAGAADANLAFSRDGSVAMARQARATGVSMLDEENRLLARRLSTQRQTVGIFYVILGVSGVLLVVLAAASIWLILRYIQALGRSRDSLEALNDGLEQAVVMRTRELQRANAEIQRFAYIVSHDLRSPLVNVLGFTAELEESAKPIQALIARLEAEAPDRLTDAVKAAVREDIPEAIGFIRTSTQKMDRLINAILKLSREGRRTITAERLDMDRLAQAVADSLRHRLDEKGAVLTVEKPLPVVMSDRVAVEQILSNLMENAVKYLKPGRPGRIAVRGRREGDRAIFEVEDNGRGIDPKDHERVFDLFRRAGVQDQAGEGIGLAHVRALAYRLGGIVSCASALDAGAVFSLSLPFEYDPEASA